MIDPSLDPPKTVINPYSTHNSTQKTLQWEHSKATASEKPSFLTSWEEPWVS